MSPGRSTALAPTTIADTATPELVHELVHELRQRPFGEVLDALFRAAPSSAPTIVDVDTVGQHVPGMTPRAFADGCRAERWPSFRSGRRRVAKLADVLAALSSKPLLRRALVDPLDPVERAIACGKLRRIGGAR